MRSQPSWDQTEQGNLLCQLPLWETQIVEVTKGEILFDGVNILELEVDERARMGLFLAMQYPSEIPGITNAEFLRAAMNAGKEEDEKISIRDFIKKLDEKMELLNMKEEMAERYLNEGFSGGEKKRNEILQLLMLEPTFALWMKLTLVWISMLLRSYLKGLMQCGVKVLSYDHHPLPTFVELHYSRCRPCHDGRPCRAFRWTRIGCTLGTGRLCPTRRRTRLRL